MFLDRDGTINRDRPGYVKRWEEFEFLPGALEALRRLADLGAEVIVVSNQSAVGRGLASHEAVEDIHRRMIAEAGAGGGRISKACFCPHAPWEGCGCRKPKPGLLVRAAEDLGVDLARAFMVGDAPTDMEAALAAGCRPVWISRDGHGGGGPMAAIPRVRDLYQAALWIEASFSRGGQSRVP